MRKRNFLSVLLRRWRALLLVDRLLLIFMAILLIQSGHNLFFHELTQQDSAALDVAIRSTSAAIFGYFISAGFRGAQKPVASEGQTAIGFLPRPDTEGAPTARAGSAPGGTPAAPASPAASAASGGRVRQQMLIVGFIGISSLLLLVLARNYAEESAAAGATLSQLRDFVSGSVGFLIGHAGSTHT